MVRVVMRHLALFRPLVIFNPSLFGAPLPHWRLQHTPQDCTYKFTITNLLKTDSLYNYGMQPVVYSEARAEQSRVG